MIAVDIKKINNWRRKTNLNYIFVTQFYCINLQDNTPEEFPGLIFSRDLRRIC